MADTTDIIKSEISKKQLKLEKLQKDVAKIPDLEIDINALQRSLSILNDITENQPIDVSEADVDSFEEYAPLKYAPLVEVLYAAFKGATKPMTTSELLAAITSRGREVQRKTLSACIYRELKVGNRLVKVGPGIFGLSEWINKEDEIAAEN